MNMPGFHADLSLVRRVNAYERFDVDRITTPGAVRPAMPVNLGRAVCWCAEEGMEEVGGGGFFDWFGTLVEVCVRWDCVVVPLIVDV